MSKKVVLRNTRTGESQEIPGGERALVKSPNWYKDETGWHYLGNRTTIMGKISELLDEEMTRLSDMHYRRGLAEFEAMSEDERNERIKAIMEAEGVNAIEAMNRLYPEHIKTTVRREMAEKDAQETYRQLHEEGA